MNDTSSNQPPKLPPAPRTNQQGDATGGVIPYRNPHALTAYYLGVFSIIPVLGLILGCIAVPLGISGLKQRKKLPIIRGAAHAWVGIICGGLSVLVHGFFIAVIVVSALRRR